ncbi:MAG TPA: HEAT repeat domain-containing protein, partial [Stellaceae bacterium]
MKNQNAEVRRGAAGALGKFGPAAADAVPALVEALKNQDVYVSAAHALQDIGSVAVPALVEALKNQ